MTEEAGSSGADPSQAGSDDLETDRVEAGEAGEAGSGPAMAAGPDSDGEHEFVVINNFYDQVLSGPIGIDRGPGGVVRRESGKVAAGDIARAQRYYLPPPPHDQALSVLTDRHLVALVGPEGSGRAAASMVLARQVSEGGSDLVRLPPSYPLADISGYRGFKPGQAYLLHDWSPVTADTAAARFDFDQLLAKLKETNAFLIMTIDRASGVRAHVADVSIEWCEPDPLTLFDHCLAKVATPELSDADIAQLARRAAQLRWPRHVVRLAELCIDGPETALAEMGDAERDVVMSWLHARPGRMEVLSVTALAFVSGVAERRYEALVAALAHAEAAHRLGPDAATADGERTDEEAFRQRHAALLDGSSLAALLAERDPFRPLTESFRPGFRTPDQPRLVIAALHGHFGHELWTPVRNWLFELAGEPFGEEHLAIGSGLAMLAHCAFGEVEENYLDQWSAGRIRSRLLAVDVLWTMADDSLLAPRALRLAVSWVRDRGTERALTAAICLGGPLGQRYPSEAIRWLWVLSQRSERIGRVARTAMARLFAMEADARPNAADDADAGPGTCAVPRGLLKKIGPLLRPGVAVRDRRAGLALVNAVLAARGTTSAGTAAACVVRGRPADIGCVGELWAMTLESAPHRGDAIVALHETLAALAHGPDPARAAAQLGAAIVPRIGPDALRGLHAALADPQRAREVSNAVIRAFLGAASRSSAHALVR